MMNPSQIRVGLLAYGAIGHEHNLAIQATNGLELTAVADVNPERVTAAQELAPGAEGFSDATAMLDSGLVDLVVVSTPPDSHASWAHEALTRGIHVVLEKPMALTSAECDELIELAAAKDLLLIVYQNRRFDQDFVTMRALINDGAIGEAFQYDSFVGGYSRPCDYWHSNAAVSGGAIFDWGSHYLDQVLNLFDEPIAYVTGINHKRHWHHVTNADHAQVTLTFESGRQATFTHSDLAAARRPKYYVLGTEGAIVGDWNPAAEPAVADLPALITRFTPGTDAEAVELLDVPAHQFHGEIAGRLLRGEPMQVSTAQSRDVVAVMEAAEESARHQGRPVTPVLTTRG
jgi:scyllo-inositol 2-dehydrogenase (NADP+)